MGKIHDLYVCKRVLNSQNEYRLETETYEKPKKYNFLYMPTSSQLDYQLYGERISRMQTAYVKYKMYRGVFSIGDKAYLKDSEMQDINIALKDTNCENANYTIVGVDEQNLFIKLTFEKIQ